MVSLIMYCMPERLHVGTHSRTHSNARARACTAQGGRGGTDYELSFTATKAHRSKNRYTDIGACDATRVILRSGEVDYINANHVTVPVSSASKRRFILAQGPMEETAADFWRMSWEQKCAGIVMVTSLVEAGRQKCHLYYPHIVGRSHTYQEFTINCYKIDDEDDWVVTFLRLTNTKTSGAVSSTSACSPPHPAPPHLLAWRGC
jgi:protein tyrosine phosphatase